MSARKINKQDTSSGSNDTMPFFNKIEDNKALNQLLYYVYDDEFVLMINELSSSILAYHKSINKYFSNIRILLNKMGESSYLTAIEGNCSHLENSFRKFYSNAKVVFRKMKLYRNEKFKNINESTSLTGSKTNENKTGLTIIINNNNNNNNNSINNEKIITGFSRSPQQKNSPNFLSSFSKIEKMGDETDTSTDKIISLNKEKSYILEKKVFNLCESVSHLLRNENNEKLISSKPSEELHLYKNFIINKKNNTKIDFLEYLESNEKKITTKINYLISSKKKVFSDIESLIETSQKEKKDYNNQINSLKSKIEQITNENKNIIKKLSDKNIKLLQENESLKKNYENDLASLSDKINDIEKQITIKENSLNKEISKNKEIMEQKNNLSNIIKTKKEEIENLEEENDNLNLKLEQKIKECNEYKQKYKNEQKLKEDLLSNNTNIINDIEKYKTEIKKLKNE